MVTRLRNINPVQFALVYGLIAAVFGLIIAILWLPFGAVMATMPGSRAFGAGMGVLSIVVFPIFYFICGFIGGIITAALYNLVAGWTGGVEVTLETAQSVSAPPPAQGYTV